MHPADIAYLLEALPQQQRFYVWDSIEVDKAGSILLELSDAIRASLLSSMAPHEMVSATEKLDSDEIADLAPNLARQRMAVFVYVVYKHFDLGLVMMATIAGIAVPMIRNHVNLDPAMGTSVILTFIADNLGLFYLSGTRRCIFVNQ